MKVRLKKDAADLIDPALKGDVNDDAPFIDEFCLIDCSNFSGLSFDKDYYVVVLQDDDYRIVNDDNKPVLYGKKFFDVVEYSHDNDWVFIDYGEGDYCRGPIEFLARGFIEDWHDGNERIRQLFDFVMKNRRR